MPKPLERALLLVLTTHAVVAGFLVNLVVFSLVIDVVSPYTAKRVFTCEDEDGTKLLELEVLEPWPGLTGLGETLLRSVRTPGVTPAPR